MEDASTTEKKRFKYFKLNEPLLVLCCVVPAHGIRQVNIIIIIKSLFISVNVNHCDEYLFEVLLYDLSNSL